MKPIFAWACLVIYLNAAATTLLPWVTDIFAHAFMWKDHMEHVHNGHKHSHHVGMEIAALQDDNHTQTHTGALPVSGKDILAAHLAPLQQPLFPTPLIVPKTTQLNVRWSFDYQNIFSSIFLPPPDLNI